MVYKAFNRNGTSYLEVPIEELKKLVIEKDISKHSRMREEFAYLEQNHDLNTFLRAKEKVGERVDFNSSKKRLRILSYKPFRI